MRVPSKKTLLQMIEQVSQDQTGHVADYIPELSNVPEELIAITVKPIDKKAVTFSNMDYPPLTLQSTSKLIPLIGLLEEYGPEKVFSWVRVEPSGDDFASIARLDQFGPIPSNPMLNSGAITLCSHIPGRDEKKIAWLNDWVERLFLTPLSINHLVMASEKRSGDRNRSLACLLKSKGNIEGTVEETLDLYFSLCSYEGKTDTLIELPYLLANGGINSRGERVISADTVKYTISIMATCGLYNESGMHMVKTGMPAKSGVSGYIMAVSPGKGAVVVSSPRVNRKGNSIKGGMILEMLSNTYGLHIAEA